MNVNNNILNVLYVKINEFIKIIKNNNSFKDNKFNYNNQIKKVLTF